MRAQTSAPATALNVAASLLSVTRYPASTPLFSPSFVFLSLQIPPRARPLARCFAFMHLQTPRRATPLYSHLYKMPGCHPPTLGLPSVLWPPIALSLFAATHPRNATVTPFPATHPKIRGVGHIMVNQQQRGCPDLTNRSDQHSVRHHGRWEHRFDFHATFAPMV